LQTERSGEQSNEQKGYEMLNTEDMVELIEGKRPEIKVVYTIVSNMITRVENIQSYTKLGMEVARSTHIPIYTVYSEDLGDERLGSEVFDNFEECIEEFKYKYNL
jgi:hypothetical protein